MDLFNKPLRNVIKNDLELLMQDKVQESRHIDYKNLLDLSTDQLKERFICDIAAFANTYGGYLFFGINEDKGLPVSIQGFNVADLDALKQQIHNLISTRLEPMFKEYEIHQVELDEKKIVLIILVKQSWNAPHRVTHKKSGFYTRLDGQNGQMDFYQIRDAMLGNERIQDNIKDFINQRIKLIEEGPCQVIMSQRSRIMLHMIPISVFSKREIFDPSSYLNTFDLTMPISHSGGGYNFLNIDGLVTTNSNPANVYSYMLLFRNGIIEACDTSLVHAANKTINFDIANRLLIAIDNYFKIFHRYELYSPFLIEINLIDIKGYKIAFPRDKFGEIDQREVDRNNVKFSIVLEGIPSNSGELSAKIKPLFDLYFNAFGLEKNYFYS